MCASSIRRPCAAWSPTKRAEPHRGSLRVGDDAGISVSERYEAPFAFTGALEKVVIDVFGPVHRDPAADLSVAYQSQ